KRAIIKRVLCQANPRQARIVKRSAVRSARPPAIGSKRTRESPIFKRHHRFANHIRRASRPKYPRASRLPRPGIDVEIRIQFRVLRLLALKAPKVLLHIRERSEQPFFFSAPKRDADRSA